MCLQPGVEDLLGSANIQTYLRIQYLSEGRKSALHLLHWASSDPMLQVTAHTNACSKITSLLICIASDQYNLVVLFLKVASAYFGATLIN